MNPLLPPELATLIPPLYAQDGKGFDAVVHAVFFLESFTWYCTEYDPAEHHCFGFTVSNLCPEGEWGYFSLDELEGVRGSLGLPVERDLYFVSAPLSKFIRPR